MRKASVMEMCIVALVSLTLSYSWLSGQSIHSTAAASVDGLAVNTALISRHALEYTDEGPDLVVQDISFSPANPQIDEAVDITVIIKNQGSTAATGFYTHLYVDPSDEPPTLNTSHTSRTYMGIPLNPNTSYTWVRTNQTFSTAGNHTVYAWVDRANDVVETDETNNLAGPIEIPVGNVGDEFEPDDLCSQANEIFPDGAPQSHTLLPVPDKDWVKFVASAGVKYRVAATAVGKDAELVVELHGTCNDGGSFGSGSEFEFTAPADGTYYVKIEHVQLDYGSDTRYHVSVTTLNTCNGYYEPNDQCTSSGDIVVDGEPQTHQFCDLGDTDWVGFPVIAGSSYNVSAINIGARANAQIELFRGCGESASDDPSQSITFTSAQSGRAYVRATSVQTDIYGTDTEYTLQVRKTASCSPDEFEGDDEPATAKRFDLANGPQTRNICPAGDMDWVSFHATAGVTYTIETMGLGSDADTRLCLYDASGEIQYACDDDSGAGKGSRITWQAASGGSHLLQVTDVNPNVAGPAASYKLSVFSGDCLADQFEDNDTRAQARPITADGASQAHNTCPAGDIDWMSVNVTPGSYVIETTDLGEDADTVITLYDRNGMQLAQSDDYGPGTASRIHYVFSKSDTYYVQAAQFNSQKYGIGTEYAIQVRSGNPPTVTPTPTPSPTAEPTSTPAPSNIRTLILVNRAEVAEQYGEAQTEQLMTKLAELAAHADVDGEIIRLDQNTSVQTAYEAWGNPTDVSGANEVAAAIRGVVMNYLQERSGVEYLVLVGDDRLLPFRRVMDNTPRNDYLEMDYALVNDLHPSGAALRTNHYLTDDYYADRHPTEFEGRELYIPDLAIGRLVETPSEITAFIDAFLSQSTIESGQVLITGYDFVQDVAQSNCEDWKAALGDDRVNCSLIEDSWSLDDYRALQLSADPPFKVQSINGHANHYLEGAPGWSKSISGDQIAAATSDLTGGLIYTLGCHSGLNVPPENPVGVLDLPQAFARKRANYIGNTGYGWGLQGRIGLSELLMQYVTESLLGDGQAHIGKSLAAAKQRYYTETSDLTGYDEKILEESTLYGLPMYQIHTTSALGGSDEFPSAQISASLPGAFSPTEVISGSVSIELLGALGPRDILEAEVLTEGTFYALDGHVHLYPGQPIQPMLYADVGSSGLPIRSVVFTAGSYEDIDSFDPVVASPVNDYLTETEELTVIGTGWYPDVLSTVRNHQSISRLVVQLGQYESEHQQGRLYKAVDVDLYYSQNTDIVPPNFTVVDALHNRAGQVSVKVGVVDTSGIQRAIVTYTQGNGTWSSVELVFDNVNHKWTGSFPGDHNTQYFVQVVDEAGNVARATNKGRYYSPAPRQRETMTDHQVYLPLVIMQ